MNLRKEVVDNVRTYIQNRQDEIKYELRRNIRTMSDLVHKQTVLKREVAKYGKILKSIQAKEKK